jgi:type VI secretion system protein ImpJ
MRMHKPLWHEGLVLTPQHFQQQEQWLRFAHTQLAAMTLAEPWGVLDIQVDTQALASGRLQLAVMKLRLPDGTPVDSHIADVLPPARDLVRDIPADTREVIVSVALPLMRADGNNCRFDDVPASHPHRYVRDFVNVVDLVGDGVEQIGVERLGLHLLFEGESHAGDVTCAVARLVRGANGGFQIDAGYVPPCLSLAASKRHTDRIARLADILLARATALAARRGERIEQVAEFGVADVSLFWLLHCIHTHWPKLSFLASHPQQSPERLYAVMAELSAALMTFSTGTDLSAIPMYRHDRQDEIFTAMERLIRELLNAIIPSRVVPIGLVRKSPTSWTAQFLDERLIDGADYYLSVSASLPAAQLIEQVPRLCKIGAPDDIAHIVNSALPGVPLITVQRVPAAIPVRLENQYFALDTNDPAHARMLAAQACHIYLPGSVTEATLELYAVLKS